MQWGLAWAFNHELDYIYVPTHRREPGSGRSLTLHKMLDMWHNSRFPQKLLREVVDDANVRRRVAEIHVVFSGDHLGGIAFEYEGGAVQRSAGCLDGDWQTMLLEHAEIPLRMDVVTWGDEHGVIVSRILFLDIVACFKQFPRPRKR